MNVALLIFLAAAVIKMHRQSVKIARLENKVFWLTGERDYHHQVTDELSHSQASAFERRLVTKN